MSIPTDRKNRLLRVRRIVHVTLMLVFLLTMGPAGVSSGQTVRMSPRNFDAIVLEVLRPHFDGTGSSLVSASYTLSYDFGVGRTERTFLTASLPVAHTGLDEGDSHTALGNPYVGVTLFSKRDPVVYQFGVRVPVASDNAGGLSGFYGDYDRFEAYLPDLLSFRASLIYFPSRSGDWVMFTRVSPVLFIRTGQTGSQGRGELLADYSIQFLYYGQVLQGGLGLTGRAALTDAGNFSERTVHHLAASLQKDLGVVIPGVQFQIPFDSSLRDVVNYVLGLTLVVPMSSGG